MMLARPHREPYAVLAMFERHFQRLHAAITSLDRTMQTHIKASGGEIVPAAETIKLTKEPWFARFENEPDFWFDE